MKLLTKLGGLVAVAAVVLAGASLLVSPTPVSAAANGICNNGSGVFLSSTNGLSAGAAVSSVASGSTTDLYVLIDDAAVQSGQIVEMTVSQGTANGSATGAALTVDSGIEGACTAADLATGDTTPGGGGADDDAYAKFTYVAPTVSSNTVVVVNVDFNNGTATAFGSLTITVPPTAVASISAAAAASAVAAAAGTTDLTVTVKDADGKALSGIQPTAVAALGLLETDGSGNCVDDNGTGLGSGSQSCKLSGTNASGQTSVSLYGAGASGTANITFISGSVSGSVSVVFYGAVATATGTDVSVQVSATATNTGQVTLTLTDAVGNPIPNNDTLIDDVDLTVSGTGVSATAEADTSASNDCGVATEGTNSKGQCVITVTTAAAASTGDRTLTINAGLGTTGNPKVTVTVAGATASITSDAPASVAANSQTEITVTGLDANGVNIGAGVATTQLIIEGNGGLIGNNGNTVNGGTEKFTFVAPSQSGTTTILVQIGSASLQITVNIGAAAPTPGAGFAGELSDGVNLTTYGGGTVAQLGADGAAAGATSVSVTVGGSFIVYVVGAPSFVNQAFSDQFPDGVPAGTVVLVLK